MLRRLCHRATFFVETGSFFSKACANKVVAQQDNSLEQGIQPTTHFGGLLSPGTDLFMHLC